MRSLKILFVHQNFPGQFLHLAPEMQRRGHDCLALTDAANSRDLGIPVAALHATSRRRSTRRPRGWAATTPLMSDRGVAVARAALQLRDRRAMCPT